MKLIHRSLILATSTLALSACGADEIATPGAGSITINNPPATPTPTPTPQPTGNFTAASGCPTINATGGLADGGVINVPGGTVRVCSLPSTIDASSTLPFTQDGAKVVYELPGRVDVGTDGGAAPDASDGASDDNVVLTIEGGAVIFGGTGNSFLVVQRGNEINAQGSATNPIIFTSEQNVLGSTTDDSEQQWGGVVLLGRAPIADCDAAGAVGGTVTCEAQIEGTPTAALYGGATSNDSSGTMRYVQIRYSGFPIAPDNELQSLTTGGTGSGTTLEYIQSVNSSDDGVEFFGGVVNARYFAIIGAGDDSIDTDSGLQLNMQYVVAVQRTGTGNGIIEADSGGGGDDLPRQDSRISNGTFVAQSTVADAAAIRLRGGTDFALANIVLDATGFNRQCLDIDDNETLQTVGAQEDGAPLFASVYMACPNATSIYTADGNEAATEAAFDATANNNFAGATNKNDMFTITLSMNYINGANETGAAAYDPSPFNRNGFTFDNTGFVGAVTTSSTWLDDWACDSTVANFGNGMPCAASPFA